jgi:hypothetical protein
MKSLSKAISSSPRAGIQRRISSLDAPSRKWGNRSCTVIRRVESCGPRPWSTISIVAVFTVSCSQGLEIILWLFCRRSPADVMWESTSELTATPNGPNGHVAWPQLTRSKPQFDWALRPRTDLTAVGHEPLAMQFLAPRCSLVPGAACRTPQEVLWAVLESEPMTPVSRPAEDRREASARRAWLAV